MAAPRMTFWGAAGRVTGSMHVLEAAGARFCLDAGLFQGKRSETHQLNSTLPIDARKVADSILKNCQRIVSE